MLRQDAFKGIDEIAATVFVATINGSDKQSSGAVHRLNARTLQVQQTVQVPRRAYALGLNNSTGTLYVVSTRDGALSLVETASGMVKGQIQLR